MISLIINQYARQGGYAHRDIQCRHSFWQFPPVLPVYHRPVVFPELLLRGMELQFRLTAVKSVS
jgi:hypothetical protein